MSRGALTGAIVLGLYCTPFATTDAFAQTRQRGCGGFKFDIMHEGPWPASARVRQGETCAGGRRWRLGGNAVFKRLYLAVPPTYGRVRLQEGGHFFYTAPSNRLGADSFTLRVCGMKGSTEGCANISYRVTIRPAKRS